MLETTEQPAADQHPSFRAVLSNKSFMNLWLAQVFSQLADKVILVYLIVLLVAAGYSANSDVSRLTLVFTIPAVLFGSVAGVFVDRWSKKWLMIAANLMRGALVLALPVALWFNPPSALWIYALTFLISTATQFFAPAEISMIPVIVEKRNLLAANSLFTTTMLASVVIGFGVGDPILRLVGDQYGHLAIGAMYMVSALFLIFVSQRRVAGAAAAPVEAPPAAAGAASVFRELKEGFDYVLRDRQVIFLMMRLIILFSAFAALTILVIGFVEDVLQLEKRYFGYLLAVSGAGMGVSAALVGRFGAHMGKERLISRGFIAMGLILMALANLQWFTQWLNVASRAGMASAIEIALAFLLSFLLGLSAAAIAVPVQTLLQEETPEHLRGKVFGVQNMLVNTAMTLPMSLAGVLADMLDQFFPSYGVVLVMNLVGLSLLAGAFLKRSPLKQPPSA
ncbi:MAG: arabinose efflux permease [Candidatus Melainabacteria bacterium HGW-Melainabacteria-1]|nr:MAG: arabinose efflux permease [Candidatus Melainabacteria bacterium HGW-Melainabacteria-1]